MPGVRWKKLTCGGDLPEPRWGHTSSQSGSNIIIFGGTGSKLFNEIYIYDTAKNLWTKPDVRGSAPSARLGHSTTTLPDGKLLVFGGRSDSKHYADITIFDPARLAWGKTIQSAKSSPESRSGHTAILSPDCTRIIIFGGTSSHYKYFTNTFILELATLTWTKQGTKGEAPPKRGGHCAFLTYNKMFIFGGYDGKRYYNDLFCLSLDTFTWSKVEATGALPKPRSGHTATLIHGGTQLLVFGGCGANSDFLSDVHVLRLSDMHWEQPKCLGMEAHARFRHTCTEVGNFLYVFSGTGSGTLLADMMLLELDSSSPPRSPSIPHTTFPAASPAPAPLTLHPPTPEPQQDMLVDVDIVELRKRYFVAMMSLKAEKQQREDYENELRGFKHTVAAEKAMRVEELEQTTHTKSEKGTKKKQIALQALQESLVQQQHENQALAKRVAELTDVLTREKILSKELKQALANVELRSQEGVVALTKELEEMKLNIAHMQGQQLESLSLDSLIDLENKHMQAYNHIHLARSQLQVEETSTQNTQLLHLKAENQRLATGNVELENRVRALTEDLKSCEEALSLHEIENAALKERTSRLEGSQMDGLTSVELMELENIHHEGLRRVSQLRQAHMQKELEMLRREKEALQEKQMCIICTERPSNCVILPCRHSSMCSSCCDRMSRCPICRSDITKRIHTYEK